MRKVAWVMKRLLLSFALSLFYHCTIAHPISWSHARDHEAVDIVWKSTYGMEGETPPHIVWRCDRCPEYADDDRCYIQDPMLGCLNGVYYNALDMAIVNNQAKISDSAFAHELLHGYLQRVYGQPDRKHERDEWDTLLPK